MQGLIEDIKQQFSLLSQKLIDLDRSLDDQARRIKEKGRHISQRMNEMGTAFAQVERVEAHINSNLEQIGFKKSLSKAAKLAEEVQRLRAHEAIPEKFLDAVSQGSDLSLLLHKLQRLSISFKESELRTRQLQRILHALNDHRIDTKVAMVS
ncbi:MAG: hypothetical protein IE928_09345 [Gammaproteobacteria bacterium]|nr:hypothetical protein [Gammaproteobacteria bacterium]